MRKKIDRKNMEPTPRAGDTIPGKKMQKMLDQELTTQWESNVEWYEKTANRPSEWGEIKTMYPNNANETNGVGRQK